MYIDNKKQKQFSRTAFVFCKLEIAVLWLLFSIGSISFSGFFNKLVL